MEKGTSGLERLTIIGGSAGSLEAILKFLPSVRRNLPFPIVIVLHRRSSDNSLSELIAVKSGLTVKEVEDKEALQAGTIYMAPGDYHLLFENDRQTLALDYSEKVNFSRPSIDVAFASAAHVFGANLTAILLSGANADGSDGLEAVREKGGTTVVQHPDSAEVAFMPQQAIGRNLAEHVLSTEEIASFINMRA
jgi:two-component system, chemotaxis family, protein-glutamate methylesterase/glutaminase